MSKIVTAVTIFKDVVADGIGDEISDGEVRFYTVSYVCGGYVEEGQSPEEYGVTVGTLEAVRGTVILKQ